MYIKQLSVFLQNKLGHLAEITEILRDAGIDIRGINISEGHEFGILRLLVDDTDKAEALLSQNDYLCKISDVLAIEPEDRIGIMSEIFKALADNGINVNYIYSNIKPCHQELPIIILSTSDQQKAIDVISDLGINFVRSTEISKSPNK